MPRPDIANATVIDTDNGGNNATEITGDEKANDTLDVTTDDTDPNRAAENTEVGGDDSPEESPVGEETPGSESGEIEESSSLSDEAQLAAFKEEMRKEVMEDVRREMDALKPIEPEAPKDPWANFNEETWARKEEEVGVNRNAIKFFTNQSMRVVDHVMAKIDERLAKFEKADAIRSLTKESGFSDATRYEKDVDEFLSSYHPKHHANPDLLKRAVIYARGKNMKANITKARNESERNRKISGQVKPPASGANLKKGAAPQMTPMQRQMARAANMSDSEYMQLKTKKAIFH